MPNAKSRLKHAEMSVIVTRADGTVEDHGIVAEYHEPTGVLGWLRRHFWLARHGREHVAISSDDGSEVRTTIKEYS